MTEDKDKQWKWVGSKDDWPEKPERHRKLSKDEMKSAGDMVGGLIGVGILALIGYGIVSLFFGNYYLFWYHANGNSGGGYIHGYHSMSSCEEAAAKMAIDSHGTINANCNKEDRKRH
jgi:hypothetical protein